MQPPFLLPSALACLNACAEAYERATTESGICHALIAPSDYNSAIVAFRGTHSIREWLVDSECDLVKPWLVDSELDWQRPKFFVQSLSAPGLKVHRGFGSSLSSILQRLIAELQRREIGHVFLTGHSKGGAEAMLAAPALKAAGFEVCGVYTFGQPRVGNGIFAREYDARFKYATWRFVNEEDIVPRVPGVLMGYRHAGSELFFPSGEGWKVNPNIVAKLVSDGVGMARDWMARQVTCFSDHGIEHYAGRFTKEFPALSNQTVA